MSFEEQVFENIDYTKNVFPTGEYEACQFINCNFSESNLSLSRFVECEFKDCNLSMVKLGATVLNTVSFKGCKMLGINFENSADLLFSVGFEDCTLNFSSFYKRNLRKTIIKNCSLQEADFTEADLTSATLINCDLSNAKFERTILEKADLSTSYNYSINPELNRIKKAKFSLHGLPGLLGKYDIIIQ